MDLTDKLHLHHADCVEFMATIPDEYFELAIVDPPYGIDVGNMSPTRSDRKAGRTRFNKSEKEIKEWDSSIPSEKYFKELFRTSKNQIIWGGNYFSLPPTRCVICWDKQQFMPSFSAWEMAWTSFVLPASLYKYNNGTGSKIHPTQKPVALYKWLLSKYAKPNDKIFDSHLGSMSIAIACHDYGFDLTGCELDADYYNQAIERVKRHIAQPVLFPAELPSEESQLTLF